LATWAVIAAVLPMAFVSGLMGPYMRPIPIGSSAAMLFSLAVAFVVTPWAAAKLLKRKRALTAESAGDAAAPPESRFARAYARAMRPLLEHRGWRWGFLLAVAIATVGSMSLVGVGA